MNTFIYIGDIEADIEDIIIKQKNNFKSKYDESNIINIDFEEDNDINETEKKLKNSYQNISLFADKKLIFLKNISSINEDLQVKILEYFKKSNDNFITIIEDNKIDKRTKFWKELEKLSTCENPKVKIQELKFTQDFDIKKWIIKKISDNNFKLSEKALSKLMIKFNLRKDYKGEYIGKIDTIKIRTQLLKLLNSKDDNLIKEEDIIKLDLNYSNPNDDDIFELVNLIFEKDSKALVLFEKNFYNDTNEKLKLDELVFFNTIMINNIEEMISVSDLILLKYPDSEIAKQLNWKNPKKIFPIKMKLKYFNKELLKKYYKDFEEIDILSKTDQDLSLYRLNLLILDMIKK